MDINIAAENRGVAQAISPLFIGYFLPKAAASGMGLIRIANWQAFTELFSGANVQDLLKEDFQSLPVMVSVHEDRQHIYEVLNPYAIFIRQAILLRQDSSLRLTHTDDELLEKAATTAMALPDDPASLADILAQMGNPFLTSYYALHYYFAQGGRACYLLPVESCIQHPPRERMKNLTLPAEITVICSLAGNVYDAALQAALPAPLPFLSLDGGTGWVRAGNEICVFDPRDDHGVWLLMLANDDNDPIPLTLAELRMRHPALAGQVDAQLSAISLPVVLPKAMTLLAGRSDLQC